MRLAKLFQVSGDLAFIDGEPHFLLGNGPTFTQSQKDIRALTYWHVVKAASTLTRMIFKTRESLKAIEF